MIGKIRPRASRKSRRGRLVVTALQLGDWPVHVTKKPLARRIAQAQSPVESSLARREDAVAADQ
jgi:hypothetical protein